MNYKKGKKIDISREVAEEVLKDWNSLIIGTRELYHSDQDYLNHKYPKKTELPDDYTGWVKDAGLPKWMVYFIDGKMMYGFDACGNWFVSLYGSVRVGDLSNDETPATPEEVYPRLKAEAERRGHVEGVEVECLCDGRHTIGCEKAQYWKGNTLQGVFWIESVIGVNIKLLNSKGEWAKPITKLDRMVEDLKQEAKRCDMDVDVVFK